MRGLPGDRGSCGLMRKAKASREYNATKARIGRKVTAYRNVSRQASNPNQRNRSNLAGTNRKLSISDVTFSSKPKAWRSPKASDHAKASRSRHDDVCNVGGWKSIAGNSVSSLVVLRSPFEEDLLLWESVVRCGDSDRAPERDVTEPERLRLRGLGSCDRLLLLVTMLSRGDGASPTQDPVRKGGGRRFGDRAGAGASRS